MFTNLMCYPLECCSNYTVFQGNVIVLDLNLDNVNKGATVLTEIVQTTGCLMTDKNSNHCDRKGERERFFFYLQSLIAPLRSGC